MTTSLLECSQLSFDPLNFYLTGMDCLPYKYRIALSGVSHSKRLILSSREGDNRRPPLIVGVCHLCSPSQIAGITSALYTAYGSRLSAAARVFFCSAPLSISSRRSPCSQRLTHQRLSAGAGDPVRRQVVQLLKRNVLFKNGARLWVAHPPVIESENRIHVGCGTTNTCYA